MNLAKTLVSTSILATLIACGGKTFDEHVNAANALIAKGDNSAAIIELKNAIRLNKNDADVRLTLARVYMENGDLAFAEKELKLAGELGADFNDFLPPLVNMYFLQSNFEEIDYLSADEPTLTDESIANITLKKALSKFLSQEQDEAKTLATQVTRLAPESEAGQIASAFLAAPSDLNGAIASLDNISVANPKSTDALFLLGHYHSVKRDYVKSIEALSKHVELSPNAYLARMILMDVLVKHDDLQTAESHADFMLKIAKDQPFSNQIKALAAFSRDDFETANRHIEIAVQNGLPTTLNKLIAGLSAFKLEKYEQAHNYLYGISSQLNKSHPATKVLAITQLKLGYNLEAGETINNLQNLSDDDTSLLAAASYQFVRSGNVEQASVAVEKLDSIAPEDPALLNKLGLLKLSLNDLDGIADLEKAFELSPDRPMGKMALAGAYLQTRDFDKALKLAEEWISASPNAIEGYNLAGFTHELENNIEKATEAYNRSLSIDSNNVAALRFFAEQQFKSEDYAKAEQTLTQLINANPVFIPAHKLNLAIGQKTGDFGHAIKEIARAREANPDNNELTLLNAQGLYLDNKLSESIAVLNSLSGSASVLPSSYWRTLTLAHVANGSHDDAIKATEDWIANISNNEEPILRKAKIQVDKLAIRNAQETIRAGLVQFPNSDNLRLVEANVHVITNNVSEAKKSFAKLSERAAAHQFAKGILGNIHALEGNFSEALPLLTIGYNINPDPRNTTLMFLTYKELKRNDEGHQFLEGHNAKYPNDIRSRYLLANDYLALAPAKAKSLYADIVQIDDTEALALNNLAYLLQQEKQFSEAVNYATKAVEIEGENPQYLDTLGTIHIALGNKQEATDVLTKAAQLAPNDSVIQSNLNQAKNM